jgi:hypothetical protein
VGLAHEEVKGSFGNWETPVGSATFSNNPYAPFGSAVGSHEGPEPNGTGKISNAATQAVACNAIRSRQQVRVTRSCWVPTDPRAATAIHETGEQGRQAWQCLNPDTALVSKGPLALSKERPGILRKMGLTRYRTGEELPWLEKPLIIPEKNDALRQSEVPSVTINPPGSSARLGHSPPGGAQVVIERE